VRLGAVKGGGSVRILQVSVGYSPSLGGIAEHVKNISERLARKHEVTVFTHNYRRPLPREEKINGVLVRRFGSFSPYAAYHFSPAMIGELIKSEFDIVHGHGYHALPLYFSRYAKRKRFVVTAHYHGHGHTALRSSLLRLYKPFGKRIFAEADAIISVSRYEKELLIKNFGLAEDKIWLIPNGINLAEFSHPEVPEKTGSILYVGRLEQYKGVQYIIQALPLLGDDYRLEIVGGGTYGKELKRLAAKLGLNQRVKFNQPLPRSELLKMYNRAGVFVLLSQSEAFSIVVAEALASRTPCVVANTSALREWVDNRNCFGVDYPIDIAQLAEAISKARGKKVAGVRLWDWDDVVRELEKIYDLGEG
jgi:glycosyltransferase involved in cell wall biosynthesis